MSEFLDMGGYGQYVWPTYALALAVLVYNVTSARRRLRLALEKAALHAARAEVRRPHKRQGNGTPE